ncbi:hypothetical protein VIBHAR_00713 [Vibrio campbellii ATCC BAA-1116]|uniref:Uncharacterized protein n=1 Tax=Vibrio campbellii (strain ATCC BAA-1116) TaxID=2902295 RepID=A7MWJ8_VIBC1|nr:hypothetical protein VIBHAR_00713 [Vibrio campbellii ATCC BAA-1116]
MILLGKALDYSVFMLPYSLGQLTGNTNVENRVIF